MTRIIRGERDDDTVEDAPEALQDTIATDENVTPAVITAVRTSPAIDRLIDMFETECSEYREKIGLA